MAQVQIRQPRFLGEKVPTREQSPRERIQESLGPGYTVESNNGGYVARAKPVQYKKRKDTRTKMVRRGQVYTYDTYIPHELTISPEGRVLKEIKRGTFKEDASGKIKTWGVYDSEVTDYEKQTRFTFGKRDLKSGRETIRKTSSFIEGKYKEKRIIDQDSAEYERSKRTDEQNRLIREKGFTVKNTEQYKVAGLSKEQRREYYRQVAKQKTAEYSLQGKAVTLRNQARRDYERDLSSSAQAYATEIRVKQNALSRPNPPTLQKPAPVVIQPGPGIIPEPQNPASPTTRTDMGTQLPRFFLGGKLPPGELKEAEKPKTIQEKYNRLQDQLSFKQSRARQSDKVFSVVGIGAGKFALGVPAGGVNVVRAVLPWNLPDTLASMVNPESYRQLGVQLATDPAKTSGEIVGAVATGYGIGKGIQYGRAKIKAYTQPKDSSISGPGGGRSSGEIVQTKLSTKGERFTGAYRSKSGLKSGQIPEGKGSRTGTIFSEKKVVNAKGQVVRTPAIEVTGHRIPGDPTRLGTLYEGVYTESGKLVGYKQSPPVKVRPEVQQPLTKPQIVAQGKTFSWDQRAVVVKGGQPYVKDLFGQGPLRKVQPGEFALRTTYTGKPGPTPAQSNFLSGGSQSAGGFKISLKGPGSGTQTQLPGSTPSKPIKITVVKDPTTGFKQTGGPKVLTSPETPTTVQVVKKAPQQYATAGEVLKGTLKVEPRYSVSAKGSAPVKVDIPDYSPAPKIQIPQASTGIGALIGLSGYKLPDQPQITPQVSRLSPVSISQFTPDIKPAVRVDPKSLSVYDQKPAVTPASIQEPIIISASTTSLRTEPITDTTLRTELRTDPIFEPVVNTPPTTGTGGGISEPIREVPPPIPLVRIAPKEKIQRSQKFKVQVREKGVFKDFKIVGDLGSAFAIGKKRVLSDETASFRIRPIGGSENVLGLGRSLGPMFRESKKEPGVFIEKRQFRIDTPGEKRKITFKGLQLLKVKSIFGKRRG